MRDSQEKELETNIDVSQKSRMGKIKAALGEVFIYAAIFILCLYLVPKFICCKYTVDGQSMETTLKNEEQLIGEKISYLVTDPKKHDVVVVRPYANDKDNYYVKRVVGIPGDTIKIVHGRLFINEKEQKESFIKEPMWDTTEYGPVTLGKDEYFVMGDNRNCSLDSRESDIGPIPKDRFVAKVFLRVWPLKKLDLIN